MKKKSFARLLSLMLVATSVLAIAGCNNNSSSSSSKTVATVEKASSFKFYAIASGKTTEELNASSTAKLIKDYTKYDVTYDQAPTDATDAQTAITNIMMSKSDYQAIQVTKNQFYTMLASDALKDITPYVEASTNLKSQISEFGWSTATKNGKIYGIPQKDAALTTSYGIAFRVDWLNEYNKANPSAQISVPAEENGYSMTLSDYKTMLTYFKSKVPQGGTAMAVDINNVNIENILPAFGIYQEWADVNGKLEYCINQPGYADYLSYMQNLYSEGLLSYQATTGDANVVKQLQAKNVGAGRIPHWSAVTIEKTDASDTDNNIGYIEALVPDSKKGASNVRVFASQGYSYYTVVPKYATDSQAAAVADWADKKLDSDFFLKMVLGTENDTYKIVNGAYYPILPKFDQEQSISDKFLNGTREADYSKYWLCRTRKTAAQDKMFSRSNYNIEKTGIKNPVSVMPQNTTYDNFFSTASTEVTTALIKSMFQSGSNIKLADVQTIFKSNKGDDITKAVNDWYTTWKDKDSYNTVKPR